MKPKTLTKFSTFHEGLFNDEAGIKISLPAEFNDHFDAQLRFSDEDIKTLVDEFNNLPDTNVNKWLGVSDNNSIELSKIPAKKPTTTDAIKYYIQRLQTTHILCLNSLSALDFNTSQMWGIYANNGKGIALEFDYAEVENRFNYTLLKSFLTDFCNADDKDTFLRNSLTDDLLYYIKEILTNYLKSHQLRAENQEYYFLKSSIHLIKKHKLDFLKEILTAPMFSTIGNLTDNLIPITYNSRFDTLIDIFKNYLFLMLSGNYHNHIGYNLVNSFFSNKHNIWQNEHEYRLIVINFAVSIIDEVEKSNCFNEKTANFKKALSDLESGTKKLGIKTLKFTDKFQLNAHNYNSKELNGDMPFSDSLPFPTKIYLGWDFKIHECETCCRVETEEFLAVQRFRRRVKQTHGIEIELYKLKKEVDYTNNRFNVDEPIQL